VTDVQAALAWIDRAKAKLAAAPSPAPASQAAAPLPTGSNVTIAWLTKRFDQSTDIDLLKADGALIAELPESEREAANEMLAYNFDRLTKGAP
jgi:anti-sigma factor RsiW